MAEQNIKIASIGFDVRSIHMISQAFVTLTNGSCIFVADSEAEIILINLDGDHVQSLYQDFIKKHGNMPAVGIGKELRNDWKIRQVVKPISTEDLVNTIKNEITMMKNSKVSSITQDKIAAAMSAIDARNVTKGLGQRRSDNSASKSSGTSAGRVIPRKTDEMCFDIERFLLGHVYDAAKKAAKDNTVAVISCWGDKTIIVNPEKSEVITDVNDNQLRTMAIAPLDDNLSIPVKIEYIGEDDKFYSDALENKALQKIAYETFMWNLGSMTCRGRIPIDTSISERMYLSRWPNVTRVKLPENALRIISYWVKQPCGLYDIQQALDVTLQDVFTVYTAAFSAGLSGEAKRHADQLLEVEDVQSNSKRGLFGNIVKRLKSMNREAA